LHGIEVCQYRGITSRIYKAKEKVVLKVRKVKGFAYQVTVVLLLLSFLFLVIYSMHVKADKSPANQKIILIRDDDVKNDTPALKWLTNLIITKNAKCTYAVIPNKLTDSGIDYLKALDPNVFELATHGYNHDGVENSVAVQPAARTLMIADFGRAPTSIAAPDSIIPPGYMNMAASLGYHSQINFVHWSYPAPLFTFPLSFAWEKDWGAASNQTVTYFTFDDFKTAFDSWYHRSDSRVFTINVHHAPLYNNVQAKTDFANSLDYMIAKGDCVFMTEEEAYKAIER
jgi:hypothetical protein